VLLEKVTPKSDFLTKDSVFQRHGKGTLFVNGKSQGEHHLWLFSDYFLCGKRSVAAMVMALTKPPMKIVDLWSLRDIGIRAGVKKGSFDVRSPGSKYVSFQSEECSSWLLYPSSFFL